MRIVTRPDFDGVVCAVLLLDVLCIDKPIKWVEPGDIQHKLVDISHNDILANLPYNDRCSLWFDHHYSNKVRGFSKGSFKIAPSAAGVIYEYFGGQFSKRFDELVTQTDRIDSADLSLDEILHPEKYQYLLLSMTISGRDPSEEPYWNYIVNEFGNNSIDCMMSEPIIIHRCQNVVNNNSLYEKKLISSTYCIDHLSISDFRAASLKSTGNRFLVHAMFPDCTVNVKIFFESDLAIVGASKSILKSGCLVNLGKMFSEFGGGGHDGAGACSFPKVEADKYVGKIMDILLLNK